jgi:hypothetical protein
MRLVHRHQTDPRLTRKAEEVGRLQTLGRHVEQLVASRTGVAQHLRALCGRKRAVEKGHRHTRVRQRAHLILHQRNERRYNERQPRKGRHGARRGRRDRRRRRAPFSCQRQRGYLVAQGLPRAGGHDPQTVFAREQALNQLPLPLAKPRVTKIALEDVVNTLSARGARDIQSTRNARNAGFTMRHKQSFLTKSINLSPHHNNFHLTAT